MIIGQSVLGVIAARSGSKGIPGKHLRMVGGRPLIAWTIDAGRKSRCIDRLILSSDDSSIMETARSLGCDVPFRRDPQLATDRTPSIDVVLDAIVRCPGHDWVVLLQPTSPLRTAGDIDAAIETCINLAAPACISVCEADENPYWMFVQKEGRLHPLMEARTATRRQELPKVYTLNGAVYVASIDWLKGQQTFMTPETVAYEMPRNRSLDVDSELDLNLLEVLIR